MDIQQSSGDWLSAHIPVQTHLPSDHADQLITKVLWPLIGQLRRADEILGAFYIRYNDGGPHIRLRIRRRHEATCDRQRFLRRFERRADTRLSWCVYEPEYDRYGGIGNIALSECLFEISSDLSVALLSSATPLKSSGRRIRAATVMLVQLVHLVNNRRRAAAILEHYADMYRLLSVRLGMMPSISSYQRYLQEASVDCDFVDFVGNLWDRLSAGVPLDSRIDLACAQLLSLRRCLGDQEDPATGRSRSTVPKLLTNILPSHLHMSSNRIGISIAEEACIAGALSQALMSRKVREIQASRCI